VKSGEPKGIEASGAEDFEGTGEDGPCLLTLILARWPTRSLTDTAPRFWVCIIFNSSVMVSASTTSEPLMPTFANVSPKFSIVSRSGETDRNLSIQTRLKFTQFVGQVESLERGIVSQPSIFTGHI